jgi:hypothetical protein
MKKNKTPEQRHTEIASALEQLSALGLTTEMEGVAQFMKIATEFLEKGYHASGNIVVHGTKRRIIYKLSMQPHIASSIILKYDENA